MRPLSLFVEERATHWLELFEALKRDQKRDDEEMSEMERLAEMREAELERWERVRLAERVDERRRQDNGMP